MNEFETSILKDTQVKVAKPEKLFFFKTAFLLYRLFRKIRFSTILKTNKKYLKYPLNDKKHLLTIMMGLDINKFHNFAFTTNHCRSIYLFDAWPVDYERIITFAYTYKIDFIFVSSSQSAQYLSRMLQNTKVFWIPEGINFFEYKHYSISNKTIDVLALGRRYDWYHEKIVTYCKNSNLKYYYEQVKGELIFPSRKEFIEGLASAKISICVPSNITHPQRAGDIETMTIRYLQSMLSKCLVIGHAPDEMIKLFGYNPVIEIDKKSPVEQLDYILKNYSEYESFIEKNYQMVLLHHIWEQRWTQIKAIYSENSIMLKNA